ncbi:hypothetical protein A4A49_09993 [Nicotiana attenuata]|uniref:Uncharacterized protein n=1 Tax=Nicotiana attenuata TaxID=49451 RepID=A0A1J6IA14_NICAT|nr:hypothetical protein A4A49_09993 [Nicotiana attenuata]
MLPSGGDRLFSGGAENDGAWWIWGSMVTKTGDAAGSSVAGSGKNGIDWKAWDIRLLSRGGSTFGYMLPLFAIVCHKHGPKAAKALFSASTVTLAKCASFWIIKVTG